MTIHKTSKRIASIGKARFVRFGAVTVIVFSAVGCFFPGASSGGDPTIFRHPVYAGAEAFYGDCPNVGIPAAGTVCTDNYVLFWKGVGVEGGGSIGPPQAPWQIYAETDRVEFDGTDGPPNVEVVRWGYELLGDGASADSTHLTTASVTAQLPMSDGTTLNFAGEWQAWSDRSVYGNNGPATGVDHHYVDRCVTLVANGHQKFRFAHMTGTVDGSPVHSYADFDFGATIFNNDFEYITVPHGGPACS